MDCGKIGELIGHLRKERGLTQRALAEKLSVTDKAVSKWERGLGCPDVSLLTDLSAALGVDMAALLTGELPSEDESGGNMKNAKYFVCPTCGGITMTTGEGQLTCCGRPLAALEAKKAQAEEKLTVEKIEDEWFITSDHSMTKDHHIAFVAFATGDKVQFIRQYPEWDLSLRIPARGHGKLLWYCTEHGLYYQLI